MKNLSLIAVSFFFCTVVLSQETIARFKYEDAEKAFVAGNYHECIDNLDEAEKLLGKTAPNILHLKIVAQYKLFEKEPYERFAAFQSLQQNCNDYLKNYDIKGLEEKYRDVYEIADHLPTLSDQEALDLYRQKIDEQKKVALLNKIISENNLVFVQGGSYTMGKGKEAHEVRLGDFYIGKYEVNNKEYGRFIKKTHTNDLPATATSWETCMDYCQWLEKQYGGTWRLPTEAEWEYAARGGNKSKGYTFSGSDDLNEVAADYKNPPGSKKPNELGIYDMSGSKLEWCHDFFDDAYYKHSQAENPMGPDSGDEHVLRGGYGRFCVKLKFGNAKMDVYDRQSTPANIWINNPNLNAALGFRVVYIPGNP